MVYWILHINHIYSTPPTQLYVHGNDLESLYKHIPQRLLPAEYGGENGTIPSIIDYWEKKIISYRDYFIEDAKYGSDEKLRIGAPIYLDNYFGVDGTFRKLNID